MKDITTITADIGYINIEIRAKNARSNCYSSREIYHKMGLDINLGGMVNFKFGMFHISIFHESNLYKIIAPLLKNKKYLDAIKLTKKHIINSLQFKDIKSIFAATYQKGFKDGHNAHVEKFKGLIKYI